MTDDGRLRSALAALAENEPMPPVPVDMVALDRARRSHRLRRGAAAAVVVAAAVTFVVQTDPLSLGGREPSTGVLVAGQPGDQELPRVATVRCTDAGTVVEPLRIAAAADGAHLVVANETADTGTYLTYERGGDLAPATPTERILTSAPGAYELSCAHSPDMIADEAVTLEVVDPDGYYEVVDAEAVLGCAFTGIADGPTAGGETGRAAADAWVAAYVPGATLALAEGYRDDPNRGYLLDSEVERATLEVFGNDQGGFSAGIGEIC